MSDDHLERTIAQPDRAFRLLVKGELFEVQIAGKQYSITWLSGPNEGYGFDGALHQASMPGAQDASVIVNHSFDETYFTNEIKSFLENIDPRTGYPAD